MSVELVFLVVFYNAALTDSEILRKFGPSVGKVNYLFRIGSESVENSEDFFKSRGFGLD